MFVAKPVDTTSAGDVFKAGVIYGQLQGWDLVSLTRFACAASSSYIAQPRGRDRVPDLAEVRALAGV